MKTLLRIFVYSVIILCGMSLVLILLPLIVLLLFFKMLVPGRGPKIHTFKFGSRPSAFRSQDEPGADFSRGQGADDVIDVEAREVGVQRKSLDVTSHDSR